MAGQYDFRLSRQPLVELEDNFTFFKKSVTNEIIDTAEHFYCKVGIHKDRLLDIWDFWKSDIRRNNEFSFRQSDRITEEAVRMSMDHLKRTAFLCFWIRRLQPITETVCYTEVAEGLTTDEVRLLQNRFMAFHNEICALKIGLGLAAIYENPSKDHLRLVASNGGTSARSADVERGLNAIFSHWEVVRDYLMVFKYKNVSPYMIYLLFKTIFLKG